MKRLIAAACFVPVAAFAQPYIELGVGTTTGGCLYRAGHTTLEPVGQAYRVHPGCSRSPLGLFAVGYQFNDRWRIQWDHWSSLPDTKDRGMEIISIRYRYTFR